ncbi:MAG: UDP-N-acetylmuramoyl-tripeptide--D-alanyl-D-alanine ligase [Desulfobacterales bacterium]
MTPLVWPTKDILEATGGDLLSGGLETDFAGISIDSRQIGRADLFVAIKGERFDGHDFIPEVLKTGVKGVVVEKAKIDKIPSDRSGGVVQVAVNDTIGALGALAGWRRKAVPVKVAAITGSNGKTTTKEMTAAVLGRRFAVLATSGNHNNEIGLPLTLFGLCPGHQWAVLEMGMNHPGEIARLAGISMPDIGVITNVGRSHLEGLGSVDAVAREKAEILGKLASGGTAVLNADDPRVASIAGGTDKQVLFFGRSFSADVRAENIESRENGTCFELILPRESIGVHLKMPGTFMVSNALAAAGVGFLAGLHAEEIKDALETVTPVKGRMDILRIHSGAYLIDDTYNSNPDSAEAAISALQSLNKTGRSALVFGDMLELGESAGLMHTRVGQAAGNHGVHALFLPGEFARDVARGASEAGVPARNIFAGSKEEMLHELKSWVRPGDWILVKGSRSTHMETIVNALLYPDPCLR